MIEQEYIKRIQELSNPSFKQILDLAKQYCGISNCPGKTICKPWQILNHGTDLLETHENLCKYLCVYGAMHEEKLHHAFSSIKDLNSILNQEITIIDWGCGQGLATICFIDYLKNHNIPIRVNKVILIEPAKKALNRANLHLNAYVKENNKIKLINKYLDNVSPFDISAETPIVIHFFSNILDIKGIDLKLLSRNICTDNTKEQYLICIAPLNSGNKRIEAFYNYFNEPEDISNEEVNKLPKTKKTLKLLIFKLQRDKVNLIQIEYFPPVQFHAAYRLDSVNKVAKSFSKEDNEDDLIANSFELAAPFDIGASIYDDVHPVFAVINNIITRGLPTKASPFIEQIFELDGNKKLNDALGNLKFKIDNLTKDNLFSTTKYLTPIGVARVQKTIIEALLTKKISIDKSEWNVLVIEQDVPCSAIAFKDLKLTFDHLTKLSKDFASMEFPKVNLEIISPRQYFDSSLHLNIKPSTELSDRQMIQEYDMVIDISVLEKSDISKVNYIDLKCKNNCYFLIRSANKIRSKRYIYTSDTIEYLPLVIKDAQGNYNEISENKEHLKYFLQLLFRKEDFRPGQLPILDRALQNKSVIGLLPTGGGKSLTYQLAGLLQPGVTIIIDPLRSLMQDQYDGLLSAGIDTCTYINSTLTSQEKNDREKQMESSQMQFVFLSPERLCIYRFRQRLKTMQDLNVYFAYGVIDEVHCVSEWGHDFRFSYLHLGRNLYNYVFPKNRDKRLTLFGLTATASFDVLADVERELSGNGAFPLDAETIIRYENTNRLELQYKIEKVPVEFEEDKSFDRKNILKGKLKAFKITDKWSVYESKQNYLKNNISKIPYFINELQSKESLKNIIDSFNERQNLKEEFNLENLFVSVSDKMFTRNEIYEQAGIVFCPHKDNTPISVGINSNSLKSFVPEVGTFVGSSDEKDLFDNSDKVSFENLNRFRNNSLPLMIATKAFGMGIDKPNVRFTINMNYSSSLESFVQEAGRAGRDRKIALASIMFSDYKLVRINSNCPIKKFPMGILNGKWFKKNELISFLKDFNISIDEHHLDYFTPEYDMVKLRCDVCHTRFAFDQCKNECSNISSCNLKGKGDICKMPCKYYDSCSLKDTTKEARNILYVKDLESILSEKGLKIDKKNFEYINADYETVMYFYNNNFKGSLYEKQQLFNILSQSQTDFFYQDDEEIKPTETVYNLLEKILKSEVNTEIVAFISYNGNYSDYAKAIYRLCCIDLIDDFTQDYNKKRFRVVAKRKKNGEYYLALKNFLLRYYSADKAEDEISKVPEMKGENEIQKCLGYLTEFIYDKIALKRKRAIDDIRSFCIQGLNSDIDWKEVNEVLKDEIYYYFNSKYAKENYIAENGENFSLTKDTDKGKESISDLVFKYMRVIDVDDPIFGLGDTPKDNIKHLQGAVRLIRRSLAENNAVLDLLNAFCLFYLGTNDNKTLEDELKLSYKNGLIGFFEPNASFIDYWGFFLKYHYEVFKKASEFDQQKLNELEEEVALNIHSNILKNLTIKYLS